MGRLACRWRIAKPSCPFARPISGALLALSIGSIALALWQHHRTQARLAGLKAEAETDF